MRRASVVLVALVACGVFTGCTHKLQVKNLNSYQTLTLNSLEKRLRVGIIPSTSDIHAQKLIKGVGWALGKLSADVLLPYSVGSSKKVDVIANVSVRPEYKGSGWNFLINFPGFLIFTPAWHGLCL